MTAISRHICCLLNIGGTFYISLPEDYFCIIMIVPFLYIFREIQDTSARSCARTRHETAPLNVIFRLSRHCIVDVNASKL